MSSRSVDTRPSGWAEMSPVTRIVVASLVAGCLTSITAMLLAGHGPWSGHTIIRFSHDHGLNSGDIPVLIAWAAGMTGCAILGRGR